MIYQSIEGRHLKIVMKDANAASRTWRDRVAIVHADAVAANAIGVTSG